MPRPLVFGNPSLLVALDGHHQIRDLFWPILGRDSHLTGNSIRLGIWLDGHLHWTYEPAWQVELGYEDDCLVGSSSLTHEGLGIRLKLRAAAATDEAIFVIRGEVEDMTGAGREARVYLHEDLNLEESSVANTTMYHPDLDALIHYKKSVYALLTLRAPGKKLSGWTCAVKPPYANGAGVQCVKNALDGKAMEVGTVDGAACIDVAVPASGSSQFDFLLVMGQDMDEVCRLCIGYEDRGLEQIIDERRGRDQALLASCSLEPILNLPEPIQQLARKSLLFIRTQIDGGGAILAANDADVMVGNTVNYSNSWPRDGALVADALGEAGDFAAVGAYLSFCIRTLPPDGMYRQKYWADGRLGPSWHPLWHKGERITPFQQDETSLVVWMACRHLRRTGDDPGELWTRLIRPACQALLAYRCDKGLPRPSWDLWEERRGVSFFCVGATIGALAEAARTAEEAGDELAEELRLAAIQMAGAARTEMVGPDGAFVRQLDEAGEMDLTADSATVPGLILGGFDLAGPEATATLAKVEAKLQNQSPSGGCARYEGDYYFRQSEEYPGSPWFICTLWIAQAHAMRQDGDPAAALEILEWARGRANESGVMSEQMHPVTGAPLSVSPLTWSHAEFLRAALWLGRRWTAESGTMKS